MNTKPIATYTERLLEVRREFALYDDRVVVQARWLLKGRFERVVQLATLKSEIQELTIRYRMYRYGGWVMASGALVFAVSYYSDKGGALGMVGHVAMGAMICRIPWLLRKRGTVTEVSSKTPRNNLRK